MSQPQETGVARWGTAETAALHMREHGPYARTAVLALSAAHPRKARLVPYQVAEPCVTHLQGSELVSSIVRRPKPALSPQARAMLRVHCVGE